MINNELKQVELRFQEIMETYCKPLLIAEYGLSVWDYVYAEVQSPVSDFQLLFQKF